MFADDPKDSAALRGALQRAERLRREASELRDDIAASGRLSPEWVARFDQDVARDSDLCDQLRGLVRADETRRLNAAYFSKETVSR